MRYKCSNCDNELKEDSEFCSKCGYRVIRNVAQIGMSVDSKGAYKPVRTAYVNPEVIKLAKKFINAIPELKIEYKTDEYTTLTYNNHDMLRIEWVYGAIRLRICPSNEDRVRYANHPFFASQINKKVAFWNAKYMETAFQFYVDMIKSTMVMDDSFNK